MSIANETIESTLIAFCQEFIQCPYLCYTEHGLHALFFSRLMDRVPEQERYGVVYGERVCLVQKEYPTHSDLRKGRRQHWDIAVIDPSGQATGTPELDHLPLVATIEFGMNEAREHLEEDVRRLVEDDNSQHKYIVHLYRISSGRSGRDWKPSYTRMISPDEVATIVKERSPPGTSLTVFYGYANRTDITSELYRIDGSGKERIF